jgi:hypothetical protein
LCKRCSLDADVEASAYHESLDPVVAGLVDDELKEVSKVADVAVEVLVVCPYSSCGAMLLTCPDYDWSLDASIMPGL